MKEIMKRPLFLICLLAGAVLSVGAVPTYTMRSCAPMQSGYSAPASSVSACPRIGYTTAPAASYGRHGAYTTAPYSPYSAMTRSYAMTPAAFASAQTPAMAAPSRQGMGPRRVHSNDDGGMDGDWDGEYYEGKWWNAEDEEWTNDPFEGCVKVEGGLTYVYQGTYPTGSWVLVSNQTDPDTPIGDTPWLFFLLLAAGYTAVKLRQKPHRLSGGSGMFPT